MGTINHKTSDYITMAIRPYDIDDFRNEEELSDKTDSELYDLIHEYYEDDWANVESVLNKQSFYYFHVEIEAGYYEGFSVQIENNMAVCYDNYEEKKEALLEVKAIKSFLLEIADLGMRACYPGWHTTYDDRNETIKAIKKAAAEMRKEVMLTPCWRTLRRIGEIE